jgi:hypothetical protein
MSVDIEYVGDPPLMDDITRLRIQTGEIPASAANILRKAEQGMTKAVDFVTKRIVDPEWFGTSRQYVFGPMPGTFVQAVEDEDVDKIMGSESSHQFRIVVDTDQPTVIKPNTGLVLVDEKEGGFFDVYGRP